MQIKDSENDCQQVKTDLLIMLVTNAFNNALHKLFFYCFILMEFCLLLN